MTFPGSHIADHQSGLINSSAKCSLSTQLGLTARMNESMMFTRHFCQVSEQRGVEMNISTQIPSVNFHLWKPCNMKCRFCFATFQDVGQDALPKGHLPREDCLTVVDALAKAGFDKINFAGREPTLCPWLPDLIR